MINWSLKQKATTKPCLWRHFGGILNFHVCSKDKKKKKKKSLIFSKIFPEPAALFKLCTDYLVYMDLPVRKCTFGHVHPAKIQTSLCIGAVGSESSLATFWIPTDSFFMPTIKKMIRLHRWVGWFESLLEAHNLKEHFLTLQLLCLLTLYVRAW